MKKILLSLLLTVVAAVPAFAQMPDMPMREHRGGHEERHEMCDMEKCNMEMMGGMMGRCLEHADAMGLSDDQIAKMKPAHNEMQKKHARFTADARIAEIELREIMEVKDFDLEKANAAAKKIADIKTDHQLEMLNVMKEMRSLLTDEQFAKMKKIMPMQMDDKKAPKKMLKK